MATRWSVRSKSLAFFQADLWGEMLPALKVKRFRKEKQLLAGFSKPLFKHLNLRFRGKRREPKSVQGKRKMVRLLLSRFYIGMKVPRLMRLFRLALRRKGFRAVLKRNIVRPASSTTPADYFVRLLETRVGSLSQRMNLFKSTRALHQHIVHKGLFVKSGRVLARNSSVALSLGHSLTIPKSLAPSYYTDLISAFRRYETYTSGYRYKRKLRGVRILKVFRRLPKRLRWKISWVGRRLHLKKMQRFFAPYIATRRASGFVRSYQGRLVSLGGPHTKRSVYYPFVVKRFLV